MTSAYPLHWPDGWPRTKTRSDGKFLKATVLSSVQRLQTAVRGIGSRSLVVSSNLEPRNDLMPRSDDAYRAIVDPGVAVYFDMRGRPSVLARDAYVTVAQNLQSLTIAIEHLKGLERHGGGHMMERAFTGFAQLPPPDKAQGVEVDWQKTYDVSDAMRIALQPADIMAIVEARHRERVKAAANDHERMIVLNAAIVAARAELKRG